MTLNRHPTEMLVLAGGFGTRLRSVINGLPKPMAPIHKKPFLSYLIDYWIKQGVQRFVLSVGYLPDIIQNYFGSNYRGVLIEYVNEPTPLGTGGALRLALNEIEWLDKSILMANGDTWFPIGLRQLCEDAKNQRSSIIVALKQLDNNDRYSGVRINFQGEINEFGVKSDGLSLINGGCYLLNVNELKEILKDIKSPFSFENDFLPGYSLSGMVGSSVQDVPFLDIGIPEDYKKAPYFFNNNDNNCL